MSRIERGVFVWINGAVGVTGTTVYFGESNAPRPDNPSVRLKIIDGPRMTGFDGIRPANLDVQLVSFDAVPDSGSFRFAYGLEETELIGYLAGPDQIQDALQELTGFSDVVVVGNFQDGLAIVFEGLDDPGLLTIADNTLENAEFSVVIDVFTDEDREGDFFRQSGPRPFTLSVNAYGDSASQMIQNIQSSIDDRKKMMGLHASNLSALRTSSPRDISTFVDSAWEQRFQMDIEMMAAENIIRDVGSIETMEAGSTIGGHDDEISIDAEEA